MGCKPWHARGLRVAVLFALAACGPIYPDQQAPAAPPPQGGEEGYVQGPPGGADNVEQPPAAGSSGSTDGVPVEMVSLLNAHNQVRAKHCAKPLAWSAELAAVAQKWADTLKANNCAFEHSQTQYGENLAGGTPGASDGAATTAMWYDEVAQYNFGKGGFSMDTGHFTQVVWQATERVGCAKVTCSMDIWVCNYDPPGNYEGQFQANVKPAGCQ
jgi:uncharacterized protein YkwD